MARPLPLRRRPLLPWRATLRRLRRSLALRWLLVAGAGAAAGVQVTRLAEEAAAARDAWGQATPVVVAARSLAIGDVVSGGDVRVERWPRAVVPEGALAEAPLGRVATATIVEGEIVVGGRVAPGGLRGAAALVPAGWRAVAVPGAASGFGAPTPPLAVGDRVDLLAPDLVAAAAVVVAVDDDAVTVAVPADDAGDVAAAVATAAVTLALVGAG